MSGGAGRRAFFWAGGFLALGILAFTVRGAVGELRASPVPFDFMRAVAATLLLAGAFLVAIALWRSLLSSFDRPIQYRGAVELWSFSNLGRYLPGKIWQVLGVMAIAKGVGATPAGAASVAFISLAFQVSTGALVALPILGLLPDNWAAAAWIVRLAAAGVVIPVIFPGWIPALLGRLPRSWGVSDAQVPARRTVLGWLIAFLGLWVLQGFAFSVLMSASGAWAWDAVPSYMATWALAYVGGLVAVFAPGGIGVREEILSELLVVIHPETVAPHLLAVISRLWAIAAELLILVLAVLSRAARRETS